MSIRVCLSARTLKNPTGGGQFWVYLNWALGLRSAGCDVIWLEDVNSSTPSWRVQNYIGSLKSILEHYGFSGCLAICSRDGDNLSCPSRSLHLDLGDAAKADLFLNMAYSSPSVVARFRRSALLDIDPGLLQIWLTSGKMVVGRHDVYFTIGETVGQPDALFPDAGIAWQYTPPCVALDSWPVHQAAAGTPYTTVTHWSMDEWMEDGGQVYANSKQAGFEPFLSLPRYCPQPLELALPLEVTEEREKSRLHEHGWAVRDTGRVAARPWAYQSYVQGSRGEFSCAKPSCIRLQNAWISDRTLCYLASGKPAVVQHTGPSRFLPADEGLLRFRSLDEAIRALAAAESGYERHCRKARALAEEYFDARRVVTSLLERALV